MTNIRRHSQGFTIIELLIATVIFAVVLLVVTGAIMQFGRTYYKGLIQTRTQDVTRNISQDIAQSIQFSRGGATTGALGPNQFVLCAGGKRYTYNTEQQLGTGGGTVRHGLVSDSPNACSTSFGYDDMDVVTLPAGAREYLGENMQLLRLVVTPTANGLYEITVRVAYGDSDDLVSTQDACKAIILGGQFCAVSTLTTTVAPRLN